MCARAPRVESSTLAFGKVGVALAVAEVALFCCMRSGDLVAMSKDKLANSGFENLKQLSQATHLGANQLALRAGPSQVGRRPQHHRIADVVLLRQWYSAVLRRYEHMTLKVTFEDGGYGFQAFQVLDLERRNIITRPFVDTADELELEGLYTISMQPLEVWGHSSTQEPGDTLETFVYLDPMKIDIIAACGADPDSRKSLYAWEARSSDVDGCVEFHSKQLLLSRQTDLMGKKVPVLSLLDALDARGFFGVEEVVSHTQGCRFYDCRRLQSRRAYLQCVLHAQALAAKGVLEFHSAGTASYFEALLRGKQAVRPGLPALEYKRQLAIDEGDVLALASLDAKAKKGRRKRSGPAPLPEMVVPPQPQPIADGGSSDDGSVVGGSVGPPLDDGVVGAAGGAGIAGAASDEGGASIVGGAMSEARTHRQHELPEGVLDTIAGSRVRFVPGRTTQSHTYADRLSVRCTNAAHPACAKSRSMALLRTKFGLRSAEAFLGAWLAKAESMTSADHAKYVPKVPDMEAYLSSNP